MWEAIGWIGSGIVVISMMQARITRLRLINLVGSSVSLAYAIAISAWPLAGLNAALAAIQAYHLAKLWTTRHDAAVYQVAPADPGDAMVAQFLERHGEQIAEFFPHFSGSAQAGGANHAFFTVKGDTIVGLVLAHIVGDEATLEVDYVTPTFRDLTPGEFVFRTSRVWQEAGVRTVIVPGGGPDYYARIGFEQTTEGYRLSIV